MKNESAAHSAARAVLERFDLPTDGDVLAEYSEQLGQVFTFEEGLEAIVDQALDARSASEITVSLPSGQVITVWIGTSEADGSALVQIDTAAGIAGNVRVFINDSYVPLLDENPETGKYEDMQPDESDEE